MATQEQRIVSLILNVMAFEGAKKHFRKTPPDLPRELFDQLQAVNLPSRFATKRRGYRDEVMAFDEAQSVFDNCFWHLGTIRNNIIHANKAFILDPEERLNGLLDWADAFIRCVYDSQTDFAACATEIKGKLKIESY